MASEKLNQAVVYIKAGNKQAALPLLKEVIQLEPNNEMAWLWLYSCVDSPSQKKYCLQKALEINPNNQNARIALDKLVGQTPSPKSSSISYQTQPEKKQPALYPIAKSGKKLPVLIIGLVVTFLFLCVVIGGASYWGYNNMFRAFQLANATTNTPNSNGIVVTPENTPNTPQNTQSETPKNQPFSAIQLTNKDIKLIPIDFLKVPSDDPAWSLIKLTLGLENYTHYELAFSNISSVKAILKTKQGYEYKCSGRPDTVVANNRYWTEAELKRVNADDFILNITFPEHSRTIVSHIFCVVPTDSNGYILQLVESFNILPNNYWEIGTRNLPESPDLTFEVNPEKIDPNLKFPLLDDLGSFPQENTLVFPANQQVDLGDIALSFKIGPTKDILGQDVVGVLMKIQNKFAGSDVKVSAFGSLLLPNGRKDSCSMTASTDINIGDAVEVSFCRNTITPAQIHPCLYIDDLLIKYTVENKDNFLLPKHLLICFQ